MSFTTHLEQAAQPLPLLSKMLSFEPQIPVWSITHSLWWNDKTMISLVWFPHSSHSCKLEVDNYREVTCHTTWRLLSKNFPFGKLASRFFSFSWKTRSLFMPSRDMGFGAGFCFQDGLYQLFPRFRLLPPSFSRILHVYRVWGWSRYRVIKPCVCLPRWTNQALSDSGMECAVVHSGESPGNSTPLGCGE